MLNFEKCTASDVIKGKPAGFRTAKEIEYVEYDGNNSFRQSVNAPRLEETPYFNEFTKLVDATIRARIDSCLKTDKFLRRIVSMAYEHKDTRLVTEGLKALKVWESSQMIGMARDFCKMWGIEFATENGSEKFTAVGITDVSKQDALAKTFKGHHFTELVKRWRKDKREAEKASQMAEGSPYAETVKSIERINSRATKRLTAIAGNDSKKDEISFLRKEREFSSILSRFAENLIEVQSDGIDLSLFEVALNGYLEQAKKQAKETA